MRHSAGAWQLTETSLHPARDWRPQTTHPQPHPLADRTGHGLQKDEMCTHSSGFQEDLKKMPHLPRLHETATLHKCHGPGAAPPGTQTGHCFCLNTGSGLYCQWRGCFGSGSQNREASRQSKDGQMATGGRWPCLPSQACGGGRGWLAVLRTGLIYGEALC